MSSSITRARVTTVGLLIAGTFLTGCGGESAEPRDAAEVAAITDAINSGIELEGDLWMARNRVVVNCLAEAGFDVHAPDLTTYQDAWKLDGGYRPLMGSEPPGSLPTVEEARDRGFYGETIHGSAPDSDEGELPYDPDDPFFAMPEDYLADYGRARYGEAYYDFISSRGSGDQPEMAGCTGEMTTAVTEATGIEDGQIAEPAAFGVGDEELAGYETEGLLSAQSDWSACVEDRGYPYFEFTDNMIDFTAYIELFYETPESTPLYDIPPGAPWEFDEAYAYEVAFAVDVAECADETGLRETMETEWNRTMEEIAVANAAEIFAWHDQLEDAVAAVQVLLSQ